MNHQMLYQSQQLEQKITQIQKNIEKLPPGKLFITHSENRYKWYYSNHGKQVYIPKSNRELAEKLAYKKYLQHLLEETIQEKTAIDFYLRHCTSESKKSEALFMDMPEYTELLSPFFQPMSEELKAWATSDYTQNPYFPEQLNNRAVSGIMVRSKSEAMIDRALYTNKIPYRYECALELKSNTIFPDFTIRHPRTGKTFYWEHFGLMDQPDYCSKAIKKLQNYTSNGIIPSIDLITTYETKNNPLGMGEVENIVQRYFIST